MPPTLVARTFRALREFYGVYTPRWVKRILHPAMHPRIGFVEAYSLHMNRGMVPIGPCRGLRFGAPMSSRQVALPQLLGTYEMELHPAFERLRNRPFARVIDVGAAEGYYAVGLLLWRPDLDVLAFEMNAAHRDCVAALANENGVAARLSVRGFCDAAALRELGDGLAEALLIVDVEGYEKELLDPTLVPALYRTTMLVEVHDCFVPGCTDAMRERFSKSHVIHEFRSVERDPAAYPIDGWLKRSRFMAPAVSAVMADGRTEVNGWLLLEPIINSAEE